MMKLLLLIVITIGFVVQSVSEVMAESEPGLSRERIVMASARPEDSHSGKILKQYFTEVFNRLDMDFVFAYYPLKRASLMANAGEIDGEVARAHDYNKKYENLIRVDEPIIALKFSAFSADPNIKLKGWESLKGTEYLVEYIRGTNICDLHLPNVVDKEKLSRINYPFQGLNKLVNGRTDIFIAEENTVLKALGADEFKNSGIKIVGRMADVNLHAFLHKKHKNLVPKLSNAIKKMRKEALFMKSYKSFQTPVN